MDVFSLSLYDRLRGAFEYNLTPRKGQGGGGGGGEGIGFCMKKYKKRGAGGLAPI